MKKIKLLLLLLVIISIACCTSGKIINKSVGHSTNKILFFDVKREYKFFTTKNILCCDDSSITVYHVNNRKYKRKDVGDYTWRKTRKYE